MLGVMLTDGVTLLVGSGVRVFVAVSVGVGNGSQPTPLPYESAQTASGLLEACVEYSE